MNITALEELFFGADSVADCAQFLTDYGLAAIQADPVGGRYEALDGTGIVLRHRDDPSLPAKVHATANQLRKTVYGVADAATLDAIVAELGRDREVKRLADGSIESVDDAGFVLGFQLSKRRALDLPAEIVNAPGVPLQRAFNLLGVDDSEPPRPRSLSHVVYFVPDAAKLEAFYVERLGFVCTDRFTGVGPFLRPTGNAEHHVLFFIETPPHMTGVEHLTFHMAGPTELLHAGTRFTEKGYQTFWGPGRHRFGSNWFWYFRSPLGCHVEYDADMDVHDDAWIAREAPMTADASQIFLFQHRDKWVPSGGPPPDGKGPRPGANQNGAALPPEDAVRAVA